MNTLPAQARQTFRPTATILAVITSLLLGCGGEEKPIDRPFVLSEIPAEDLTKQGMEKEVAADTAIVPFTSTKVTSHDGSKVAWCSGKILYVADAGSEKGHRLHAEEDDSTIVACFDPAWSTDGTELSFREAHTLSDSSYAVTNVVVTLGSRETEE